VAYETFGHTSPFWLAIALLLGVATLVASGTSLRDAGGLSRRHGQEV
jgi:hypothetical protein